MVSNATGPKTDLKIRKFVYVTNTCFRMNTRFKLVPESGPIQGISNGEITNFGNL